MRRSAAFILAAGMLIALSACGQRAQLALEPGQQLPSAPYGRAVALQPDELLKTPSIAIPERSVELRTRSEERNDDAFDLPPPE